MNGNYKGQHMAQLTPASIPYLTNTREAVDPPGKGHVISPATSQPYNWICHLKITMKSQAVYGGTGFWVNLPGSDVKCILTAGHCLKDQDGYAERVEVTFPGQRAFSAAGSELHVSAKWKPNSSKYDFGAICIKDMPKSHGGFEYSTTVTNEELLTTDATMFGYPADKPYQTMWGTGGCVCEVTPFQFRYTFCADHGQSGSAVYIWHNGYVSHQFVTSPYYPLSLSHLLTSRG
jgi:glutamyl endopeptidase